MKRAIQIGVRESRFALALAICAVAFGALADEEGYVYSADDKTLTVTVAESDVKTFNFADYGAYLTDNLVTNFIKAGTGKLIGASDIGTYLGDITVEAGTYTFTTNRALGKLAGENVCGSVYVKNGATLDSHPLSNTTGQPWGWFNKHIVFEGDGVNGDGALVHTGEREIGRMVFSSNLVMTANATIGNWVPRTMYMSGGSTPMWLDMNGHTLTFKGNNQIAWGCWNIKNPGRIISYVTQLTIQNGNTHLNGDTSNTLVISNGTTFAFNRVSGTPITWTLDARNAGAISVADGGGYANATNVTYWAGPVLLGDKKLSVALGHGWWFSFRGPLSGTGGLYANNSTGYSGGQLNLISPDNTFAGGVALDCSVLGLWNDGALPADGAALAMTNSSVLLPNKFATYSLPDLQVHGTGLVERGSGSWKTATKTGVGELLWDSYTSADVLDVKAGTVSFLASRSSIAGLIESERRCYNGYAAVKAAWDEVFTNIVTMSPEAYYNRYHHIWSDPKDEGTDRYLVAYTGYIWNNESTNVTWSFAGAAGVHLNVRVDGRSVFYFAGAGEKSTTLHGSITEVTPGHHTIDIRGYHSGTSGSFSTGSPVSCTHAEGTGQKLYWTTQNFAVGFDPYGRESEYQTDYIKLIDPGDGSLLTWTLPEHVDSGVTEEPGTARKVYYGVPNFDKMKFAAGTGMKSEYDSATIPELEGLPAVTGVTNLLTISTAWTIPAADFVGGSALTTSGSLALGSGATVTIADDDRAGRASGDAVFTVATATGGITVPAGVTITGATREWKLFLSADTKTLYARHIPRGTALYLK